MGINANTQKFKEDLVLLINNSNLPICIIEMVLSAILAVVQTKLKESIETEKEE